MLSAHYKQTGKSHLYKKFSSFTVNSLLAFSKKFFLQKLDTDESIVEIDVPKSDCYNIVFDIASNDSELSQNTITVYANGEYLVSLTVNGTSSETLSFTREVKLNKGSAKLTVAYPEAKIEIKKVKVFGN